MLLYYLHGPMCSNESERARERERERETGSEREREGEKERLATCRSCCWIEESAAGEEPLAMAPTPDPMAP